MRIVAGTYKHRLLVAPKGDITRPTSERLREALFNICQSYIEDADFLDLFAGSGAMGIEALSRGARSATFIDSSKDSIRAVQQNLRTLQLESVSHVFQGDVFALAEKLLKRGKSYNIIYADPPYEASSPVDGKQITYSTRLLQMIDEGVLLKPAGTLFIEEASGAQPIVDNLKNLKLVSNRRMGRSSLLQFEKI